jgi:Ca-activated chloride channel family protein
MTFENPLIIAAGLALVIASFPLARLFKDALILEIPLGPFGGTPFKPPHSLAALMYILRIAERAAVLLLFIAAAGPFVRSPQKVYLSRGADIIFVLDISPSMACLDMNNKSRFDAARNLVRDFASRRPTDAIGLAGVGKDAALLVPPTLDRSALFSRLESLRLGELGDGTALGLGLALAALHISDSAAPRRAVVLITDGENNAGAVNPGTGAGVVPEVGASLWVIAVGSNGQIPIDYVDPFTKIRRTGLFESRFDPESLRTLAGKGNGTYIGAPSADTFTDAFARLDQAELTVQRTATITRTRPLHLFFIAAGLVLLFLVRFIRRSIAGTFL